MLVMIPPRVIVQTPSGGAGWNAFTSAGSPPEPCQLICTVSSALSNSTLDGIGLDTGSFNLGSLAVLINNSTITGANGSPGASGNAEAHNLVGTAAQGAGGPTGNNPGSAGGSHPGFGYTCFDGQNGSVGGAAVRTLIPMVVINNGTITGGSGGSGGNGGGSTNLTIRYSSSGFAGTNGGGGGGGGATGAGGVGRGISWSLQFDGNQGVPPGSDLPAGAGTGGGGAGGNWNGPGSSGTGGAAATGGPAGTSSSFLFSSVVPGNPGSNGGQGPWANGFSKMKVQVAGTTSGGTTG